MTDEAALAAAKQRIEDYRAKIARLDDNALDMVFREARSHNWFTDRPVSDDQLREIYDLVKFCSTSANTQPMRVLFVRSAEAKERLKPALLPTNVDKTMIAPATAIVGYDNTFWKDFALNYPVRPEMGGRFEKDAVFHDSDAPFPFGEEDATIRSKVHGGGYDQPFHHGRGPDPQAMCILSSGSRDLRAGRHCRFLGCRTGEVSHGLGDGSFCTRREARSAY